MNKNLKIGIIGLGLIGGSMARDFRKLGHHVVGHDKNPTHLSDAIELGLIAESSEVGDMCAHCDVLVIAIPVLSAPELAETILDQISLRQVLIDTGSTKASICSRVRDHKRRGRYVSCHPLSGTEYSGPTAAIEGLYQNKKNIICDEHLSDEDALEKTVLLMQDLGMQNLFMSSEMHDEHMAYVSHLSHVSSFMLGSTVLDIEEDEKQIFNLASTGFASTVRLAKSSPDTWTDIFLDNADNITTALESYIDHLQQIKTSLINKEKEQLRERLSKSNDIKRVLTGIKYNVVKIS